MMQRFCKPCNLLEVLSNILWTDRQKNQMLNPASHMHARHKNYSRKFNALTMLFYTPLSSLTYVFVLNPNLNQLTHAFTVYQSLQHTYTTD